MQNEILLNFGVWLPMVPARARAPAGAGLAVARERVLACWQLYFGCWELSLRVARERAKATRERNLALPALSGAAVLA